MAELRRRDSEDIQLRRECAQKLDQGPREEAHAVCDRLYGLFKQAYFAFGSSQPAPALGEILPYLKQLGAGHAAG